MWAEFKKRVKYWWRKNTDTQFQWGHPDEWDDAEWYYYKKEQKRG